MESTGYTKTIHFGQYITDYWVLIDHQIIQFIQWVIPDVHTYPINERRFFYSKRSLQYNFTKYHTPLPPTYIQEHQCCLLQEYSRLYTN